MDIRINGEKADIIIETEKTVGDILAGLDNWLSCGTSPENKNLRLSGLRIDGREIDALSLEDSLGSDLAAIQSLDITVSNLHDLIHTALRDTQKTIEEWARLDFQDRRGCAENWKTGPAAALLLEQYPELFAMTVQTLSGGQPGGQILAALIDERMRELENPEAELAGMEQLIVGISGRLENLPLDIQTGKDRQASETVQLFTGVTEKIFRIFNIFKAEGLPLGGINVISSNIPGENASADETEIPVADFLSEFNASLQEMLAAYEQKDAVLVGDLAEYEMAPRLRAFYAAIKNPAEKAAV